MANIAGVLITHPGRQHSHQLAMALQNSGMLTGYWTGVPAKPIFQAPYLRPLGALLEKHEFLPIPGEKIKQLPVEPVVRRIAGLGGTATRINWSHRAMDWFDRWCAAKLQGEEAQVVVGYENAALSTFKKAKEYGMTTVLDAASFHHRWQDKYYSYPESARVHQRICTHKDREIELADVILTVSELARESYINSGVDKNKVYSIPMGCDLSQFVQDASFAPDKTFRFVFAGHAGKRKGIDHLVNACKILDKKEFNYKVHIAGNWDDGMNLKTSPNIKTFGWIPHHQLSGEFAKADCMVLPSRHDSFGMVVVEAMAAGTPVIVSSQTGAKEAVTEGDSGWVISVDDEKELAERMEWCIRNRKKVQQMREKARRDAEKYSWEKYHERVQLFYKNLLDGTPVSREMLR